MLVKRFAVKRTTARVQHARRSGAALVEAALTLPIFFLVVFGIIEFGRAFMVSQLITNAAREGARTAIIGGATNSDVETKVKDFLTSSLGVTNADITVTITITAAPGNPNPNNDVATAQTRDLIEVKAEISFDKVALTPGSFLNSKNLVGQAAMRRE